MTPTRKRRSAAGALVLVVAAVALLGILARARADQPPPFDSRAVLELAKQTDPHASFRAWDFVVHHARQLCGHPSRRDDPLPAYHPVTIPGRDHLIAAGCPDQL